MSKKKDDDADQVPEAVLEGVQEEGVQEEGGQEGQEGQKGGDSQGQPEARPAQQTLTVDDSKVHAGYTNFCRVSSTPEELILDVGLNPNPFAPGEMTVYLSHRIIMNHFTAKRLLSALSMALQRHEQAFGVLETDVRKRVRQPT